MNSLHLSSQLFLGFLVIHCVYSESNEPIEEKKQNYVTKKPIKSENTSGANGSADPFSSFMDGLTNSGSSGESSNPLGMFENIFSFPIQVFGQILGPLGQLGPALTSEAESDTGSPNGRPQSMQSQAGSQHPGMRPETPGARPQNAAYPPNPAGRPINQAEPGAALSSDLDDEEEDEERKRKDKIINKFLKLKK